MTSFLLGRICTLVFPSILCTFIVAKGATPDATGRRPVLVELFTSEGCSSCPPADHVLANLDKTQPVAGVEILVLSEHVDYWDSLGWKDPNSSPLFTLRQETYARKFGLDGTYTPELVVDGHAELVGGRAEEAVRIIAKAAGLEKAQVHITRLDEVGNRARVAITVDSGKHRPHAPTVYLAVATDQTSSSVLRGENAGRHLTHIAVVRTLDELGPLGGDGSFRREVTLKVRQQELQNLRVIAFLQDSKSLEILGAASLAR